MNCYEKNKNQKKKKRILKFIFQSLFRRIKKRNKRKILLEIEIIIHSQKIINCSFFNLGCVGTTFGKSYPEL